MVLTKGTRLHSVAWVWMHHGKRWTTNCIWSDCSCVIIRQPQYTTPDHLNRKCIRLWLVRVQYAQLMSSTENFTSIEVATRPGPFGLRQFAMLDISNSTLHAL